MNRQLAHRTACRPCVAAVLDLHGERAHLSRGATRHRVASAPPGQVPFVSVTLLFLLIRFHHLTAAASSTFWRKKATVQRRSSACVFTWCLHRSDWEQQGSQWGSALPGVQFSCRTGECLSRLTPHKPADNLLLCLLICLPDNPRIAGTLSFPPSPPGPLSDPLVDSRQLQLLWRGLPL